MIRARSGRAARFLGIDPDIADVPAAGRLVSWRPRVEFRHPLMRSAAYYAAPAVTQRRAHEALTRLARDTLLDAYATAQRFGWVGAGTPGLLRAIPAAPDAEVTVTDLLLDGFAAVAERSYDSGAALLRRAIAPLTGDQPVPHEALPHFLAITNAANLLFDDSAWYQIQRRWTAELRDRGAFAALLVALIVKTTVGIQEACSRALRPLPAPMTHESAATAPKTK